MDFVKGLFASLGPVLYPLGITGITWAVNKYNGWFKEQHNFVKDVLIVVVPFVVAFAGQKLGIDVSTAAAAVGSIAAIIQHKIGQANG